MYTRMVLPRKSQSGVSLVELLVVLGIIAIITGVSIPVIARLGLFTSNKAQLAAREVFTILRAAKIYAVTYNVETAVVYGINIVEDSFLPEGNGGTLVTVVDSMTIVRRLKRDEMIELKQNGALLNKSIKDPPFVLVREGNSEFKQLPNGTCILPDFFRYNYQYGYSETGLHEILIFDTLEGRFLRPRTWFTPEDTGKVNPFILAYGQSPSPDVFPAHRFSSEGALLVNPLLPQQRLKFRVGILPDADPTDRFFVDIGDPRLFNVNNIKQVEFLSAEVPGIMGEEIQADPPELQVLHDPDRLIPEGETTRKFDTPIDIDLDIFLYVATGRVKVGS